MKRELTLMALCLCMALPTIAQVVTYTHPWQGKKVAYFGDSITDPRHKATQNKYWSLLQQWLGITPYVYAVSGRQWNDIPRQATECLKEHGQDIDAIIIFMGTNDYNNAVPIGHWYDEKADTVTFGHKFDKRIEVRMRQFPSMDPDTYLGRINIAMDTIRKIYPDKQIVVMTPIHRQNYHANQQNWQCSEDYQNRVGSYLGEYIEVTKQVGNRWAVSVIDMNALCGLFPMAENHGKYFFDSETDRLHPNAAGHERMAKVLMQQLLMIPIF